MKNGFKETNKIKKQSPPDSPIDGKNSPWDFRAPQYDQRHSCYINAGTKYGTGLRQPVGHSSEPKQFVDTLPMGRVDTRSSYEES